MYKCRRFETALTKCLFKLAAIAQQWLIDIVAFCTIDIYLHIKAIVATQ